VVAGSCRLKARVVERDEQEAELRWVLNYGHTIGHALEAATKFTRWAHGEAVALGIVAEARLAERLGLATEATRDRQVRLLRAVGLPVAGLGAEPDAVLEALHRDKKARDGRIPFVLAPEIGRFQVVFDVPPATILETLHLLTPGA
jgi:3-dehydroquinate synthase